MTDKFKSIPTAQDAMVADIENIRRAMRGMIAAAADIAAMRRAFYDAHIEAGFDEKQSLELCKSMLS